VNGLKGLLPRIFQFLGIIITMGFAPGIYAANLAVGSTNASNVTNMIGMTTLTGFGGFLLVLAILLAAGIMTMAQGQTSNNVMNLLKGVWPAISVTILLGFMNTYLTNVNSMIQSAIDAGDTAGQSFFGFFGILGYLGIIATAFAGTGIYGTIAAKWKGRKGSKKSSSGMVYP
jgi:hypothetical protein